MLDMEGIYQMVHNQTTIKRAIDYVHEGGCTCMAHSAFGRADAPAPALLRFVALSGRLRRRFARF